MEQNIRNHTNTIFFYGTVTKIVDGDGFFVKDITTNKELEIRLLGIDAPESKLCSKLRKDENEVQVASQLLYELGLQSKQFLQQLLSIGSKVSWYYEDSKHIDRYSRYLAIAYLQSGICINETIIKEGFAKPLLKYKCNILSKLVELNSKARRESKGLYSRISYF